MKQLTLEEAKNYENWDLLAKQTVEGFITGLHKSPYHGFSVEFAEHKIYNPGQGTRHIDWKVYAKTDKLFIKRYEEETNLRCSILIDTSLSMYYPTSSPNKIFYASWMAAAFCHLLAKQRDAVGLQFFSSEVTFQSPVKSSQLHLHQLMLTLQQNIKNISSASNSNIVTTLHLIAEQIHRRSLVVIFTDMFDVNSDISLIINALQHLRHKGHEVLVFHVYEPETELQLEFSNRPHLFTDIETGEKIKLNPQLFQEKYEKITQDYFNEVAQKCGALKISFVKCPINLNPNEILMEFLTKRSSMK